MAATYLTESAVDSQCCCIEYSVLFCLSHVLTTRPHSGIRCEEAIEAK